VDQEVAHHRPGTPRFEGDPQVKLGARGPSAAVGTANFEAVPIEWEYSSGSVDPLALAEYARSCPRAPLGPLEYSTHTTALPAVVPLLVTAASRRCSRRFPCSPPPA
jgi:hypothetical protein